MYNELQDCQYFTGPHSWKGQRARKGGRAPPEFGGGGWAAPAQRCLCVHAVVGWLLQASTWALSMLTEVLP